MKIIIRCLLLVFMLIQVTIEGWAKEVGTAMNCGLLLLVGNLILL